MKKIIVILLFIHIHTSYGQDSLKVQQKQQHYYYQQIINNFNSDPFLYYIIPFKNYTKATLSFSRENKNIKKIQEAKVTTDLKLKAEGIYKKKNTLFVGNLSYSKNYKNTTAWNLTNIISNKNETEKSPFYNLAYSKGNWNNQYYKIDGSITFPLIKNKLFSTLGLQYNTSEFFGTIQPKSKLKHLNALGKVSFYYKLKNNYFGISFIGGFLNNRSDIIFDGDDAFFNIPANTDIFIRTSYGYGTVESALNLNNKENETKKGFSFSHKNFKDKKLISSKVSYVNTENSFYTIPTQSDTDFLIGKYNIDKLTAMFNYYNFLKGNSITLDGSYTFGENFRTASNGKNYESNLLQINATYQIIKQQAKIVDHNYGISLSFYNLFKKDFQSVNNFDFSNIKMTGFYGKDFFSSITQKVYLKGSASYELNLDKSAYFFTNNRFTDDVALPNFEINTANKIVFSLDAGFQKKLKNATFLNIGVNFTPSFYLSDISHEFSNTSLNHFGKIYFSIIY